MIRLLNEPKQLRLWEGLHPVRLPGEPVAPRGFQQSCVHPNLTAREFLSYLAAIRGLNGPDDRITDLLELVNLGMGNELSLNMVFFGGLIAGFLAKTRMTDANASAAGIRAGIVGGLPGLWFLVDVSEAATVLSGPLWFRSAAIILVVGTIVVVLFGLGALVGLLGAKVGGWLARRKTACSVFHL